MCVLCVSDIKQNNVQSMEYYVSMFHSYNLLVACCSKIMSLWSVESQKGIITVKQYSIENQKGTIGVQSQWR